MAHMERRGPEGGIRMSSGCPLLPRLCTQGVRGYGELGTEWAHVAMQRWAQWAVGGCSVDSRPWRQMQRGCVLRQ